MTQGYRRAGGCHLRLAPAWPLGHISRMRIIMLLIVSLLAACKLDVTGIELVPGWKAQSVAVWRSMRPDMLALSPDGKWLYLTCETEASLQSPSLGAVHLPSGRHMVLLYGLNRADGLKFAPDGSLWIGEEFEQGLIWRIAEPNEMPAEQHIDRERMEISSPSIAALASSGTMAHEGIAFSRDGQYVYLADEWKTGCLYRQNLISHRLEVLHETRGWLPVLQPDEARLVSEKLRGRTFNRLEDLETLPDGRILMAETGTGRILMLDDLGEKPVISLYLQNAELRHPDNLAWDESRRWLWITDDDKPSRLWAWDGRKLIRIATHPHAEITGVLPVGREIYLNLQGNSGGPDLTMKLMEEGEKP